MCNSEHGRGVCGDGFIGFSDRERWSLIDGYVNDVRFGGVEEGELVEMTVNLKKKEISVGKRNQHGLSYSTSFRDLEGVAEGVRLSVSLSDRGDYCQMISLKWTN